MYKNYITKLKNKITHTKLYTKNNIVIKSYVILKEKNVKNKI